MESIPQNFAGMNKAERKPKTITRETKYWILSVLTVVLIFTGLFLQRPTQRLLLSPNLQLILFVSGMILSGLTILFHGLKGKPGKLEVAVWSGLICLGIMFFFRLGAAERSHLLEYAVLAVFIYMSLKERFQDRKSPFSIAAYSFLLSSSIGILDEVIQNFLPERVFDYEDIVFNTLACLMAILISSFLSYLRNKSRRRARLDS